MALPKKIEAEIPWQPYSEQAVVDAQKAGRGVIIDTFADWCIPCKELDQATFIDVGVKTDAERFVTLKLDLTRSDGQFFRELGQRSGRCYEAEGERDVEGMSSLRRHLFYILE